MQTCQVLKSKKYCVNIIAYNIFKRVADWQLNSCIHRAYFCIIFVKILSVVVSINFTPPYNQELIIEVEESVQLPI